MSVLEPAADVRPAGAAAITDRPVVPLPFPAGRPIGPWAFFGVAIASLGGPLALAALIAPGLVADAADSSGLAILASIVVFGAPLVIWLRYSRVVSGSGGLFSFVEAAAGRRVALAQAAVWIVSYLLYLVYTTIQIVYDLLPAVLPGERRLQTALALAIPVTMAAVMSSGRRAALLVIGLIAAGQVGLAAVLDGVTLANVTTPASAFGAGAQAGELAKAGVQTSLLYVCASLPLFLGGEIAQPSRTIRRGLTAAYVLTGGLVLSAVAPLAAAPGVLRTSIPGVSVAQQFSGPGLGRAIGVGVAVSVAGVMLCEYLALSRLIGTVARRPFRPVSIAIGAVVVVVAPFSLIDPEGFYSTLAKPSLAALWISQLIVFLVYPRFARRHGHRPAGAWALTLVASGLAGYGLWTTLFQSAAS